MSNILLSNKFLKKVQYIESQKQEYEYNIPNITGFYLGNFKYYKLNGTISVNISDNRLIEVFQTDNIIGYYYKGKYNSLTKQIEQAPIEITPNIGYLLYENNILRAKIRAGTGAGNGAYEEWEIKNNKIISHYSINGNLSNSNTSSEIWIGTFDKIDY